MSNKFGIPENELMEIRKRDKNCVYCGKKMIYPFSDKNRSCSATIEHLNFDGPFYWREGLKAKDIAICCLSCNSSRGIKTFPEWFKSYYCKSKNINKDTVAKPVKEYLARKN